MMYTVWVIILILVLIIFVYGYLNTYFKKKEYQTKLRIKTNENVIFISYYELLCHWMLNDGSGKRIKRFLDKMNYKKVAIYGFGPLGNIVKKQIEDNGGKITLIIDINAAKYNSDIKMITPSHLSNEENADVIIVTPFCEFPMIKKDLSQRCTIPIISLEELVYMR